MRREYLLWGAAFICLLGLAWAFFQVFAPFVRSLTWALILAILLSPGHRWLRRWVPAAGPRALLTCILAALLLLGPAITLGTVLVGELVNGFRLIQDAAEVGALAELDPVNWTLVGWLQEQFEVLIAPRLPGLDFSQFSLEKLNLEATVASVAQALSQWLLSQSANAARNVAQLSFTVVVTWLALYYLLKDGELLFERGVELIPYPDEHKDAMLERLSEVVFSSVYGGMAVALTQGFLGGVAFAVLGLPSPILWGTVMSVLAFLPLVGAFVVWAPTALMLLIQGRWTAALILVVWGALVVGLVDNVLRPLLISGRTRMHPLLIFLAVLGGIQAFGFLGLFLGPILVAVVTAVLELYRGAVRGDYGEDLLRRVAPVPSGDSS